nr:MAG TPA: hypothetical protein [Caudoviricetes sp.]
MAISQPQIYYNTVKRYSFLFIIRRKRSVLRKRLVSN